jgi:ankyrin repeat protein
MNIPNIYIKVETIALHIIDQRNLIDISVDQVKIFCGGTLLEHSSALAECLHWKPSIPLCYTCVQSIPVDRLFLDFAVCNTVAEALQYICEVAAAATEDVFPFAMRDASSKILLHHACMRFRDPLIVQSLIEVGSEVNAIDNDGFSPIFYAKSVGVVQELLRSKADPNIMGSCHTTPLHFAVSGEIVDILISNGCVLNSSQHLDKSLSRRKITPLHCARNGDVVRRLIHHNADVNAVTESGKTPLHFAVSVEVAETLIAAKADVTVRDANGNNALHLASSAALARFLIRSGLKVETLDFYRIENTQPFEIAIALYESGIGYPAPDHVKRHSVSDKNGDPCFQHNWRSNIMRFDGELASAGLCRGSAFVAAFGHDCRTPCSLSAPIVSMQCWRMLGAYYRMVADDDEVFASTGSRAVSDCSSLVDVSHRQRAIFTPGVHLLRCVAAAGLAGFLVIRLGLLDVKLRKCFPQSVLRRSGSSALAVSLYYSTSRVDEKN